MIDGGVLQRPTRDEKSFRLSASTMRSMNKPTNQKVEHCNRKHGVVGVRALPVVGGGSAWSRAAVVPKASPFFSGSFHANLATGFEIRRTLHQ